MFAIRHLFAVACLSACSLATVADEPGVAAGADGSAPMADGPAPMLDGMAQPPEGYQLSDEQAISLLDRIAIVAEDLQKSRIFYTDILGFKELYSGDISRPMVLHQMNLPATAKVHFAIFKRGEGQIGESNKEGGMFGLLEIKNVDIPKMIRPDDAPMVIGETMMAVRTSNFWQVYERFKALGVRFLVEPTIAQEGTHFELVVHDPNGIRVHVVQREGR